MDTANNPENSGEKRVDLKMVMNLGIVYGMALVGLNLITYLLGLNNEVWFAVLLYVAYAFVIYKLQVHVRDQALGGYISYGKALGTALHFSVYASLILALYMFILLNWIDPGIIDEALVQVYEQLIETGMTESQAEKQMEVMEASMTPAMMTMSTALSTVLITLILGLITSAIVKKEEPLFG